MTTQSRISRQDKTRQFSQLWLLWRFWSSKSIKSQIEGRIFNFSPLTLIIVQWAVWTSLCGFVWSVQCMGGWVVVLLCNKISPSLADTDLLQLPRNTTLQMTPNCKKSTAQHTFAGVICKIWDLLHSTIFDGWRRILFFDGHFQLSRKFKKVFEFVLVAALVLVLSCWGLGLGRARNVKLSKLIKYHK